MDLYYPWFSDEGTLDKAIWKRVQELRNAQADHIIFCLWALVKDIIDDSKDRDIFRLWQQHRNSYLKIKEFFFFLSEKTPSKSNSFKDGPHEPPLEALEDLILTDEKLDPEEEADLEEEEAKS